MGVQVIEARVQHLAATLREIDARPQEFGLAMLWRLSIDAGVTHSIGRSALYSLLELLDRHCGPVLRHMYIKRALAQLDKHQGVVSALLLLRRVFATFPVYAPKQATANAVEMLSTALQYPAGATAVVEMDNGLVEHNSGDEADD